MEKNPIDKKDQVEPGCGVSCIGAPWNWKWRFNCKSKGKNKGKRKCKWWRYKSKRKQIEEDLNQRSALSLSESLLALNLHKKAFLKQVRREIAELIADHSKRDCTAIIGTSSSGKREEYRAWEGPWRRRIWAIMWNKPSKTSPNALPTYAGESLDSFLSAPIIKRVDEIYARFISQHGIVLEKHLISRVRDNPQLMRTIATHSASTLLHAAKQSYHITDEIYQTLVQIIQMGISGSVTDELKAHVGDVMGDQLMNATFAASATALLHAFHGALGKVVLKCLLAGAFHSMYTSVAAAIAKVVVVSAVTTGGTAVAAHGGTAIAATPLIAVVLPIAVLVVWWQVHRFPHKMGKKVGKQVRKIMKGEFEAKNRRVLETVAGGLLEENAREVCEGLVFDGEAAGKAVELARWVVEARRRAVGGELGQAPVTG